MLATIRDIKGQGNSAIYVRGRDAIGRFWNWSLFSWGSSEVAGCKVALAEYTDADTVESRYQATLALPSGDIILEYVRASDGRVLGEEPGTDLGASVAAILAALTTGAGSGTVSVLVREEVSPHEPIAGALVVLRDVGSGVIAGQGSSDASGLLTLNHNGGAFELRVSKSGYTFAVLTQTLSTGGSWSPTADGVAATISPPALPENCAVIVNLLPLDGVLAGIPATLEGVRHTKVGTAWLGGAAIPQTSDSNGQLRWEVPRGAKVKIQVPTHGLNRTVVVPDAANFTVG